MKMAVDTVIIVENDFNTVDNGKSYVIIVFDTPLWISTQVIQLCWNAFIK